LLRDLFKVFGKSGAKGKAKAEAEMA